MPSLLPLLLPLLCLSTLLQSSPAQRVAMPYATDYFVYNVAAPNVPGKYGGLQFLAGQPNTLLIAGQANAADSQLYAVPVVRDPTSQQIVGFGDVTVYASAPYADGGLVYAPNGALLYTAYPTNALGQIAASASSTGTTTNLTALGIDRSVGACQFVPAGYPGAGRFKVAAYTTDSWYDVQLVQAGQFYDVDSATLTSTTVGGAEGIVYVPLSSPLFTTPSLLLAEYDNGQVSVYGIDSNGDPIASTRTAFVTGLINPQGAVIDPVTGDLLLTQSTDSCDFVLVSGFAIPALVPVPGISSSSSTGVARVLGDPQFVGLLGQSFQVHGVSGVVYSLIHDDHTTLNARFVFLSSGRCPAAAAAAVGLTSPCWTHPGSYLGELGLRTAHGHNLTVISGEADIGFASVVVDGQPLLLSAAADGQAAAFVGVDLSVQLLSTHRLQLSVANFDVSVASSDRFVNLARVAVKRWSSLAAHHAHGLLGQTWRSPRTPDAINSMISSSSSNSRRRVRQPQVAELEGRVDDYAEEHNDLLGSAFFANVYRTA